MKKEIKTKQIKKLKIYYLISKQEIEIMSLRPDFISLYITYEKKKIFL